MAFQLRSMVAFGALLVVALAMEACSAPGLAPATGATTSPTSSPAPSAAASPTVASPTSLSAPSASSVVPALKLLWEAAGDTVPSGDYPDTYWPTIDPKTGDIWVALSFDSRYWIFSPAGKYLGSFGKPGTGPGEFDFKRPCSGCGAGAIAFAPDGTIFVADVGNNRIQKFDANHRFVSQWGIFGSGDGQFADASVIATDGKNVYVYDDQRNDIQVFDAGGHFLRKFTGPGGWLAVDHAGNLFASGDSGIARYDPSGKQLDEFQMPAYEGDHIGLAVDPAGRLYFNIQDPVPPGPALGLVRFDPATNTFTRWSTAGETLTIDHSGKVIYEANFVSPGWARPALRKYELPVQ